MTHTARRLLPAVAMGLLLALALALPAATLAAAPAGAASAAQTTTATAPVAPRASLSDIEDEVMCPICGVPLNLAQSPQADRERAFIQRLIDAGRTKAQIKHALVEQYTPAVLALPQTSGFSLAAYVAPIALVAGGLLLLALMLPRWRRRRRAGAAASPEAPLPEADARRLEDDLARYDL